ncbi:MAG: hypothetical protein CMM25_02510 [Rhodospirillaceae bacterium]|nr:hypothetical protein [Rhodospirillaceae bacterium]|tara:strand:+ start:385 stop:1221 length:837 start_codon:yes stop_codon:yes gene_type:complete
MTKRYFSYLCSEDMVWEDDPGIPGFKQKVFFFDDKTREVIRLWFVPPNWGAEIFDGKPDRHYHRSVVERGYQLYGDFPHWEFNTVDDFEGDLYVFKRGLFMNRPPGSLHGLLPEPRSQAGAVILYWNNGGGTSILEDGFEQETVTVPFEKDFKVELNSFKACTLENTESLEWQLHPNVDGLKLKHLADSGYGADSVDMVYVPSDWAPTYSKGIKTSSSNPWIYVLNGELSIVIDGSNLTLKQDQFFRWESSHADLALSNELLSATGCTLLCSGHSLSA